MMQATVRILSSPARRTAMIITGIIVATVTVAGTAPADDRSGQVTVKMLRQIGVMEKIVDKVLLDSPNFLVRIDDNTRGLYIPEYGVIFTLDASLTGGMMPDMSKLMGNLRDLSNRFEVKTDKDGNQTIVIKKDGKESVKAKAEAEKAKAEAEKAKAEAEKAKAGADKAKAEAEKAKAEAEKGETDSTDEESGIEPPVPPGLPLSPENWVINSHLQSKDAAQLYAAGKDELIQALLDYGDTLTSLRAGQHVMIAAFLRDNDYFKENKISRLVIKADIDDLRAYGEGKLSEKDAKSRIEIEEY